LSTNIFRFLRSELPRLLYWLDTPGDQLIIPAPKDVRVVLAEHYINGFRNDEVAITIVLFDKRPNGIDVSCLEFGDFGCGGQAVLASQGEDAVERAGFEVPACVQLVSE
jgi:hypothetical protein